MTTQEYDDWLKDDTAMRCVLAECAPKIAGTSTTVYLANRGFITGPAEVPANTEYLSIIQGGVKLTEQISLSGSGTMSYGGVELENTEGDYDVWLDWVWANTPIQIYFGDVRWPRSDFRLIFKGVVADIDSSSRNRLTLKMLDVLQRLNNPVSETKLGGISENKERLLPVLIGEVHNFEPLMVDEANHEYQFNIGASERVIEVRDDGIPVDTTPTLSAGTFRLTGTPKGQITVSAQGANVGGYVNTMAGAVQLLATQYGNVNDRMTLADLDTANFAAFGAAHPQPVGSYLADKTNVLEQCQRLLASVGATVLSSRDGLVRLLQVNFPVTGVNPFLVTENDMVDRSVKIVDRAPVAAAVKLGYCRNYTVQSTLDNGLPENHRDMFKQEWMEVTNSDATVAAIYKLHKNPEREETSLLVEADAIAETNRRLAIRKVQRMTYEYTGYADSLKIKLGDEVTLTHGRFGLSAGKTGIAIQLQPDWMNSRCIVQVMI